MENNVRDEVRKLPYDIDSSPGPLTQEALRIADMAEEFGKDVFEDVELASSVLSYAWCPELKQNESLYRTEDGTLARVDFLSCVPGSKITTFLINEYATFLLKHLKVKSWVDRWFTSTDVITLLNNGTVEVASAFAEMEINGKEWATDIQWSGCDFWFFPYCTEHHYIVYCVNLRDKVIDVLDSVSRDVLPYPYVELGDKIKQLASMLVPKYKTMVNAEEILGYNRIVAKGLKQKDNESCGIFVCNYFEY